MSKKGKAKPSEEVQEEWDGFHRRCRFLVDKGDDYYQCLESQFEEVDIIEGKSYVECPLECDSYEDRLGG